MKKILENKKLMYLIIAILIVALGSILAVVVFEKEEKNNDNQEIKEVQKIEEELLDEKEPPKSSPATNTEELITKVEKAEVKELTKDKIIFNETAEVKKGDTLAVWVYSEPKFLGYFKVKGVDGQMIIEGLEKKLKELEIDSGKHNIAITTESGDPIGYVDVTIEEKGNLKEEVLPYTKTVTEKETIKFKTETKVNNSYGKGTSKTLQEGINGEKEITYEVTYDGTGKEISRKKVSEKITKKATNKIVENGGADFNLKDGKTTGYMQGIVCTESQLTTEYGPTLCQDNPDTKPAEFEAIEINGKHYAKCYNNACKELKLDNSRIILSNKKEDLFIATINGKKYYFDGRRGDDEPNKLTQKHCDDYKLVCATW